jgi:four helix bundle protein
MVVKKYQDLEIYKISYELALKIHNMSLKFPKYELYEEGSQIRRSSKSIVINIVEGFGRRKYKKDFIKFLIYSQASCYETKEHLKFIFNSGYITKDKFNLFSKEYDSLGAKIFNLIKNI